MTNKTLSIGMDCQGEIWKKNIQMKDNLWMRCSFMSPGESLNHQSSYRCFDDSFILRREIFCIYMCSILVLYYIYSDWTGVTWVNFQKTIMAVNDRGSNIAKPKPIRWFLTQFYVMQPTDWSRNTRYMYLGILYVQGVPENMRLTVSFTSYM